MSCVSYFLLFYVYIYEQKVINIFFLLFRFLSLYFMSKNGNWNFETCTFETPVTIQCPLQRQKFVFDHAFLCDTELSRFTIPPPPPRRSWHLSWDTMYSINYSMEKKVKIWPYGKYSVIWKKFAPPPPHKKSITKWNIYFQCKTRWFNKKSVFVIRERNYAAKFTVS